MAQQKRGRFVVDADNNAESLYRSIKSVIENIKANSSALMLQCLLILQEKSVRILNVWIMAIKTVSNAISNAENPDTYAFIKMLLLSLLCK